MKVQNKRNYKLAPSIAACTLITLLFSNGAFSAGLSTDLHSTSGMANSYAGSATGKHDISDSFTNPAILSDIDSRQLIISASYLNLEIDPDKSQGNLYTSASTGGVRSDESGEDMTVPAFFFATPINNRTSFGLNVTIPFGLATKYDKGWAGRYRAIESSMVTTNINPAISYKINSHLSFGAGLQVQYVKLLLTRMIDVGTIVGGSGSAGTIEGIGKTKGDDWGYGFNLGSKFKVNDALEFGIGYRSKIKHKLEGKKQLQALNMVSDFNAGLTTPETLTLGLSYKLTDQFQLLYDTSWMRWSRVDKLVVNAENSALNETTELHWQDSWKYSLGLNYKANNKWLIRTGVAYEEAAVTDEYRHPAVPTGDRIWLSAGAGYKISNNLKIDASYVHQIHKKVKSNLGVDAAGASPPISSLQATYKNSVNVFSIAMKYEF